MKGLYLKQIYKFLKFSPETPGNPNGPKASNRAYIELSKSRFLDQLNQRDHSKTYNNNKKKTFFKKKLFQRPH